MSIAVLIIASCCIQSVLSGTGHQHSKGKQPPPPSFHMPPPKPKIITEEVVQEVATCYQVTNRAYQFHSLFDIMLCRDIHWWVMVLVSRKLLKRPFQQQVILQVTHSFSFGRSHHTFFLSSIHHPLPCRLYCNQWKMCKNHWNTPCFLLPCRFWGWWEFLRSINSGWSRNFVQRRRTHQRFMYGNSTSASFNYAKMSW